MQSLPAKRGDAEEVPFVAEIFGIDSLYLYLISSLKVLQEK